MLARFGKICAYLESAQNSLKNNTKIAYFFNMVSIFLFLVRNLKKSTKLKKNSFFLELKKKFFMLPSHKI